MDRKREVIEALVRYKNGAGLSACANDILRLLNVSPSLPDTDSELRVACHFWNLIQDHYTGFTYGDKRTENNTLNRIAADIKEIKGNEG